MIPVPSQRLSSGYDPATRRNTKEGDMYQSYSADKIASGLPVREPFEFSGSLWICTSIAGSAVTVSGQAELEAYRLSPPELFKETPTTYKVKVTLDNGETARNDPLGFYNGIKVTYRGRSWIMAGPASIFVAEAVPERPTHDPAPATEQLSLF
jgi:hypothetical protein